MNDRILFWGISILLLGILIIWFVRFFGEMGTDYSRIRFANWCQGKKTYTGEAFEKEEILSIFGKAFFIRVGFYVLGVLICTQLVEYYASLGKFNFQAFLGSWKRWDAQHYINLAKFGYQDYVENGQHLFLVFFPLYPWLLRVVHLVVKNWELACLLLSTFCFCVGSVYFYAAIKEEYGGEIARRAFYLLCCYPFSFFFGGMMTESLFFCLVAAGFFYIRRHNWFAAGVIGIFCSLCRVQGILLLGVGMVEFCVTYRPIEMIKRKKSGEFVRLFFTKGIWLFLTVIGNLIYFGINKVVEGDLFRFQYYQREHWYHSATYVSNCLSEIIGNIKLADKDMNVAIWLPELVLFIVAMLCIVYSLRRHPLRYSAYLIVYTIVNYSITFLISGGRYMLCALPMFIILAESTKKYKWIYSLLLMISLCLLGVYFRLYMSGGQVM